MDEKQLMGSEPKLRTDDSGNAELTWGRWTITAAICAHVYAGSLHYMLELDFHGDCDGGERGMYGKLFTSACASPVAAGEEALKWMRFALTSEHQEENEDDWNMHKREIDLAPLVKIAVMNFAEAFANETSA